MIGYFSLLLYTFCSVMAPQTWWDPLYNFPIDYTLFSLALFGILAGGKLSKLKEVVKTTQSKMILAYVLASSISIALQGDFDAFRDQTVILLKLYVIFLSFATLCDSVGRVKGIFMAFVLAAALVAYQGIGLKETGIGPWAHQAMYWGGRISWVGMYNGANVLCMLFGITMSYVIHLLFGPWSILAKLFSLVAGGTIINGIYLTNSRGGFLTFAIVVVMAIWLRDASALRKINFTKLALGAVAFFILLTVGPSRMSSMDDPDHSSAGRIDAWQEGYEIIQDSPFFGVGFGQFIQHHKRYAHNAFVHTMAEVGLVGLFCWVGMIYTVVKSAFLLLLAEISPQEKSIITALLVAICGFLTASYFLTTIQFDLTYIFAGLTTALVLHKKVDVRLGRADFIRILSIQIGLMIVTYATIRIFYGY